MENKTISTLMTNNGFTEKETYFFDVVPQFVENIYFECDGSTFVPKQIMYNTETKGTWIIYVNVDDDRHTYYKPLSAQTKEQQHTFEQMISYFVEHIGKN